MANLQHLKLLKRGVNIWNQHTPNKADLTEAYLKRTDLRGAYLINADLSYADLSRANLSYADLSYADLSRANLSKANLSGADLSYADLSYADLSYANLRDADLSRANLSGANLNYADLNGAYLSEADLSEADLNGAYLSEANLRDANLNKADLRKSDLSVANLTGANLTGANFKATQALNTNFESANLTGACIEDWNINKETNLTNVTCDYIYKKCERSKENGNMIFTERRPSNPDENFAPGDLARLVQKTIETVDLIFRDGIDWKSFLLSFQKLNQEAKIKIFSENAPDPLSIRAIETRDDGSFVIRINIPSGADKGEIEKSFNQTYSRALEDAEESFRRELQAKDEHIQLHRERYNDLKENNIYLKEMIEKFYQDNTKFDTIINILAKPSNNPINVNNYNMPNNNMPNNGDTYNNNINAPTGIVQNRGKIENKDQAKIAGVLNEAPQQNLNMIKVEIEQILQPLLEQYPTNTTSEQMIVASQAIQQIENNPSLKARLINAIKEGSSAALEQSLNHPVCSFLINAAKGWQQA